MSLKNLLFLCLFVFVGSSCKQKEANKDLMGDHASYISYGNKITKVDALEPMDAVIQYEVMSVGDTIDTKIPAKVSSVCEVKGCWMTLQLDEDHEVMVTFKDYGFFVPKDIVGKDVIIHGLAFVKDMPVDEQRHYALDAGQTPDDLAKITNPKQTLSFEADGVLVEP